MLAAVGVLILAVHADEELRTVVVRREDLALLADDQGAALGQFVVG
ncbi:hypothetical protein SDC9_191551 [bioreactor metagenome]|uniref:Uncharacterized protein n=1 Tax=bioreactor metagenome TaxID=1076179 RepID=A0A645HYL5_9ZZZZ